jgi:hypothetical protein
MMEILQFFATTFNIRRLVSMRWRLYLRGWQDVRNVKGRGVLEVVWMYCGKPQEISHI